jgi:hypothetical protein
MSFNEFLNSISVKNVRQQVRDFDSLLSRDELLNVYSGMNRTNNFRDAGKILTDICQKKLENGNQYLSGVKIIQTLNTIPPITSYEYIFTDSSPRVEGSVNPGSYHNKDIVKDSCTIF